METARICDADPDLLLAAIPSVNLTDKADQEKESVVEELTASGGEVWW
jgi:hypothetical protein